jgi:hypothetical protein
MHPGLLTGFVLLEGEIPLHYLQKDLEQTNEIKHLTLTHKKLRFGKQTCLMCKKHSRREG